MIMESVHYPDMAGLIWPACRKAIDENSFISGDLKYPDPASLEIFRGVVKKALNNFEPEKLESQLYKVVAVSAFLVQAIETENMPAKGYPYMLNIIWPQCKKVIEFNAIKKGKGNSWEFLSGNDIFWKNKLLEEGYEVIKADTPESAKKELIDVINVCSFMLHNLVTAKKRLQKI